MPLISKKPRCPYCDFELDKKPTRKKKCPNCSEFIVLRRGELYTEKEAKEYDLKRRWLTLLERYGATEDMFTIAGKELSKQFGFEASVNDTIWRVMNTLIGTQEDLLELEQLYLLMGEFVEEEGKDPEPYVKQAMDIKRQNIRREILELKKSIGPFRMVINVYTNKDNIVCSHCNNVSGVKYEIDDFLKKMPIPDNCRNPRGCRCWIGATLPK